MKHAILAAAFVAVAGFGTAQAAQPELFAAQAHWPEAGYASPAFTPDGHTVFVTQSIGAQRTIMVSHLGKSGWSTPAPASFSGRWRDIEPAMAPEGSYLIFISNRPAIEGGKPLDGAYGLSREPARGGNLWRVDRKGAGWGEPERLPDNVNTNSSIYAPAITSAGDILFMQPDAQSGHFRLYRTTFANHNYTAPEPLPFSNGSVGDDDPVIAPDGSFIVFSSGRTPTDKTFGESDIFVTAANGAGWSDPKPLNPMVMGSEARLNPDMSVLYFTSSRPTPDSPAAAANADQKIWSVLFVRPAT